MDEFERKVPKQESKDTKKLAEGDAGPPPPIGQRQTEHEKPHGPIGAVVKEDYTVAPTDADEAGKADPVAPAGSPRSPSGKKITRPPGDPAKLRAEIQELRVKVDLGTIKPADKGKLLDLEAELAEAEKVS
jgi:hypothetical protein